MALIGKIRGMYFRDGKSISEIARLTSLSRNTIKKWLKRAQGTAPKYRRCEVPKKLTPYLASLTQALEVDARRAKRERRSARALHAQLAGEGYQGGYTRLWEQIRHPEHDQFSVAEMLEHEGEFLMPMPEPFDGYVEKPARVSSTCLVSVARNRYSVPCELAGQMVSTRLYPGRIAVIAEDSVTANHERLSDAGHTRYDWQHYIPLLQRKPGALRNGAPFADMPAPLQQLRGALLREAGGDRVMAQVLAIVPSAGLEAVLVAVELALESRPPSGRVSVEHVLNVLSRFNDSAVPKNVATTLTVLQPPLANTARYDSLRAQDDAEEIDHA